MRYNQPFGISDPNAPYINGNPGTGVQGSIPPASSIEHDQREVVEVISRANARGYKDFTDTPCAPPSEADLQQLRKAIEGFVRALPLEFGDLIDSYVVFTVHGAGADFPDLHAALHYLSKFKITAHGRVVLQLAGAGASGPANQYVYTRTVIFDHPNNHRIYCLGAQLRGAGAPMDYTAFTLTGNTSGLRASDTSANLTMLRTRYATELRFNNCIGVEIAGVCLGMLSAVMITSNGFGNPPYEAPGGIYVSAASTNLVIGYLTDPDISIGAVISRGQGVVVAGFQYSNFYFGQCGNASAFVLDFPMISIGSGWHGFETNANASFQPGGMCLSFSNAQCGFACHYGWLFFDVQSGPHATQCAFNGQNGMQAIQANVNAGGIKCWGNGGWGLVAEQGSILLGGGAVFGINGIRNTTGEAFAAHMSYVWVAGSSGYGVAGGTWSPGLDTVGNIQSIVTWN